MINNEPIPAYLDDVYEQDCNDSDRYIADRLAGIQRALEKLVEVIANE
jgi:hypothetical protein